MQRIEIEVEEEVVEGLDLVATYWNLTRDQAANLVLLVVLNEWTKLVIQKEI